MIYCFIIGCQNGKKKICAKPANDNPKKVVFFQPPKDEVLRNVWVKNIPNNGKELKISSYVCDEHFLDHDINKYSETVINGSIHRVEWKRWKLKSGAFPQIFPVSTEENPVKKRKPPLARKPLGNISNYHGHFPSQITSAVKKVKANAVTKTKVCNTQTKDTPTEGPVTVYEDINNEVIEVAAVCNVTGNMSVLEAVKENENSTFSPNDIRNIKLPSTTWRIGSLKDGLLNFFNIEEKKQSVAIQKLLSVDFNRRFYTKTIINRELTDIEENTNTFTSLAQIEEVLLNLHNARICPGIVHDPLKYPTTENLVRNGQLLHGIWRWNKCSLLISECGKMTHCKFCKMLKKALQMQFNRHKKIKLHTKINHTFLSMKQLSRKIVVKAKREAQLKFQLKKKKEENMVVLTYIKQNY
ncbi:uncharacterized protein LOC123475621 [Daphnia magna]|uniref:uncharacterized protein LOC123475621 n=1 Tax=Daphnia magna TaxID=35525 RepID=UPI001E1BBE91|nr:uncharacterized protein LOC123475621 [Daphnia magna]